MHLEIEGHLFDNSFKYLEVKILNQNSDILGIQSAIISANKLCFLACYK